VTDGPGGGGRRRAAAVAATCAPSQNLFIILQDIMLALHTFHADIIDMAISTASDQRIWLIRLTLVVEFIGYFGDSPGEREMTGGLCATRR
jgi:hypothetical protein